MALLALPAIIRRFSLQRAAGRAETCAREEFMALRLTVIGPQAGLLGDAASKVFGVNGGSIGRAGNNDWILPDPERYVSGHHAHIEYRGGQYWLTDRSSNGTYVNDDAEPLSGRGPRVLK